METVSAVHPELNGLEVSEALRIVRIVKVELQIMVTLSNAIGAQEAAHEYSKQLCEVLALEFKLNPHSRRTR